MPTRHAWTRAATLVAVGFAAALASVLTTAAVAVDRAADDDRDHAGDLTLEVVDADTGAALPARAVLVPGGLFGAARTLTARTGTLRVRLAAGAHQLTVTHGPEWSIHARRLEVPRGGSLRVRAQLSRLVDADAYTACDLHVHTDGSPDSDIALADRIATLLAEDVHFAVVTDHNRVTAASAALAAAGIAALPGVEVTSWAPEFGHFNAFPRATAPRYAGTSPRALLRELRRDPEAFVQINHPRLEHHIGYFALAGFDRARAGHDEAAYPLTFDAVEVWNGYDLGAPARRDEVFHDWLALLARGRRVTATGGSDAHRGDAAPYVGYPRTYVQVPRARAREPGLVLRALRQGRSFVSNGPIVALTARGHGPGDVLRLGPHERQLAVRIDVQAPAWMALDEVALWAGDRRVARRALLEQPSESANGAARHRVVLSVPVEHARSLVATVRGAASMRPLVARAGVTPFAFTNPLWIAAR